MLLYSSGAWSRVPWTKLSFGPRWNKAEMDLGEILKKEERYDNCYFLPVIFIMGFHWLVYCFIFWILLLEWSQNYTLILIWSNWMQVMVFSPWSPFLREISSWSIMTTEYHGRKARRGRGHSSATSISISSMEERKFGKYWIFLPLYLPQKASIAVGFKITWPWKFCLRRSQLLLPTSDCWELPAWKLLISMTWKKFAQQIQHRIC